MEFLRSPGEISTVFLILTIGFYVFLFWRSQLDSEFRYQTNRRKNENQPNRSIYRRRVGDRKPFEDDADDDHATTH